MKPLFPKLQNYYTQTGVGNELLFAWKYSAGDHVQTAYAIDIFNNDRIIYSTGKIISNEQNNISLCPDLKEQIKYSFVVSIWDENNFMEKSEKSYFVTGVRNWYGKWIGNGTSKPFIAKRIFYANQTDNAVLSVCVPGQFEVKINDNKISPYVYEGSQTDFNKHIHYSTYDISDFIINGRNTITIEAANGWYIGDNDNGNRYFYTMDKGYHPFGKCLSLIA